MELRRHLRVRTSIVLITAAHIFAATFSVLTLLASTPATAVQSVPYLINFQGRLTDNSGNILTDGSYNIKFRLFDAASGGTNRWEADRVYGATDHRVTLQNGLFNIQFGDTTQGDPALSPSLFNNQTYAQLYLEVELPTPATATCATNGCASFTEGAMTPRQPLASSPYAMNSDTLDGLDSSAFAQLATANTFTDTATFSKSGGVGVALSGTPASGGSLLQIGSALSSGNSSGTLIGANGSFTGDLLNLQVGNATRLKVDNSGNLTLAAGATITIGATSGANTTCSGGQFLQDQTVTGGIVTGGTCVSSLSGGANTTLSNLTSPTAINQDLLPSTNNTRDLGSAAALWAHTFTALVDAGTATTTLGLGTSNATAITIGKSGTTTTVNGPLTLAAGQSLTLSSGTGTFSQTYSASTATTAHAINVANTNTGIGVAMQGLSLTPTNTSTPSGGTNTLNLLNFAAGAALGAGDVTQAVNFASATGYTNFINSPTAVLSSGGAWSGLTGVALASGNITTPGNLSTSGSGTISSAGTITVGSFAAAASTPVCSNAGTLSTCNANPSGVTLQQAYAAGSTISTSASDIAFTLNSSQNFTIATAAGGTGFTTFSLTDGINASPPAQLILIKNNDTNQALATGVSVQSAAGGITTAFDASGANITTALAIGGHAISGTNFSVSSTGAITAATSTNTINNLIINNGSLTNVGANITGAGALAISANAANLTLTAGSGTIALGSNTLQRTSASFILDVATAATSTLTVTNSNASFVANLSVEGGVGIGSGQVFSVGATNGSTISACASNQYLTSQAATGGLVTGGSCATADLQNAYTNSASPATITLADGKNLVIAAPDTTTDPSVLFNLQCSTCSASGGRFAVQDNGTDVLAINPTGGVVVTPTASQNATINLAAGSQLAITATAAPTVDQVSISNAGQAVTTSGVSGLQITYVGGAISSGGEASAERLDVTPGSTNPSTWNGLRLVTTAGAGTGVAFNGLKLEGPASPGAGTETGINITTGWDIGINVQSGGLQLAAISDPAAPSSGNLRVYVKQVSGRTMLKALSSTGIDYVYQPSLFQQNVFLISPGSTSTTAGLNAIGAPITMGAGTYTNTLAGTESSGYMANWSTGTTPNTAAGFMQSTSQYYRGSVANGDNGFFVFTRMGFPDTITNYQGNNGTRFWAGLTSQTSVGGMVASDTPTGDYAGFRISGNASETTFRFLTRNNATTTNTDTGVSMAQNKEYDLYFYCKPFSSTDATQNTTIYWRIDNLTDGVAPVEGSVTATLPTAATAMRYIYAIQNLNNAAHNIRFQRAYVETDR